MADQKKRISELPESTQTKGLYTIGVNAQNESVKVPLGNILEGYDEGKRTAQKAATDTASAQSTATKALQTANEAKTAVQGAIDTANGAKEESTAAKGTADAAKQTAETASETAASAQSTAQSAERAAQDAQSKAGSAQGVANDMAERLVTAEANIKNLMPSLFVNANRLLSLNEPTTLDAVRTLISKLEASTAYMIDGVVLTFKTADGWASWQWYGTNWADNKAWHKFGGSASVGNCYNVTQDEPISGYYDLESAIAKAFEKGFTTVGLQVTFAIAKGSWKTYQYIGADSTESNFKNTGNWLDLAGMTAGAEMIINVDYLCGACTAAAYYTLEYAIAAIKMLSASKGIAYEKSGLVITYKVGENKWETKQFNGVVSDFGEASLWSDFGGAKVSVVVTKDEPVEGGKDALSTGGAYKAIPTDINVNTDEAGIIKIGLKNANGDTIGDEHQFAVGTGNGSDGGTIVTITPETSPLYAKAGGMVILKSAIQSITTVGGKQQPNTIERVELYDRDTKQLLETYKLNKASSADNETFDFAFDWSKYFKVATQRKFMLVAYDDTDHSGSRNVNANGVDVTVKSEQTLNYTASTVVNVGGAVKTLPMYKFPNNASDKGILCTVEIFLNAKWQTLGTSTISDTYSHSITINPNNCLGQVLKHGAYPLRIHGVDVASGVVGNYLHTAIMCLGADDTLPIVVTRWYSETESASVKQYETITVDFAAYSQAAQTQSVQIAQTIDNKETVMRTTDASRSKAYTYTQRVSDIAIDGSKTINITAKAGSVTSQVASFNVVGTLIDIAAVSSQLMVDIDFANRSNADKDKSIKSNGYSLVVKNANYSTNGFVKDTFGTEQYGTDSDNGIMALRFAENVVGELNYKPFNQAAIETNGMAVQFRIRTKHIADDNARLISCIANGYGFYVTGKRVVFTTDNEATVAHTINAALKDDTITDVAIVIEPTSQAPYAGIGCVKMYFDGELIGTSYYEAGTLAKHATPITFNGTHGDLYLYNIKAWETYYSFEQSFNNYLLKLANTDTMIKEYTYNKVMASQSAEGKPAVNRPQASALYNIGIPYFVVCKNKDTANTKKNYPDYLETLNGDKKTKAILDIYVYFPNRPWQDFKAIGAVVTNQGTTSSLRPIKNIKIKLKSAVMTLLHDRSEFTGADLSKYDECAANIAKNRVQIKDTSTPTNIITVKVDYSESGGANNGASCQLYNELQRVLGKDYMTPAQNAYTGKYELNTSIDSVPCAFFRTDMNSSDATSPSYGYFHAKGNWNQDKGDAKVFGFEGVAGYNDGCLNYGDFIELIATRNQSLADFAVSLDKSTWNKEKVYVLSEFCGAGHKVFRYQSDAWTETTGTMTYTGGKWRISGDVVNPVENYELRAYNAMDWFQGVNSVDDMLTPDSTGKPIWLTYFESRYPDNDDLNAAYKDGRKVPYQLYKWLEWCQKCNQNLTESDGKITVDGRTVNGTPANRLLKFKHELHKVANVHSMICYHVFTDYIAAVDQRSKNMMVGFYLDTDGVIRMYLNHLYDGDTILGSDNDCGLTIPAELDPNNDPKGYYQGHDSVLFTQLAKSDYVWLKDYTADSDTADTTKTTTVAAIAATMRSKALATGLRPFSPDGIEKYWITDRLSKWPKVVSSYDGIRKYIEHSASNDNYFYALHGLSIQRLRDYVQTRFRYRDGFYRCGDTYSSVVSMRCTGTDMSVTIKAAKDGFFGIGVDNAQSARESVYLKAGESTTLHSGNTNLGSGVMLYIYGADRIGELDVRNATPKQSGWSISNLVLVRKLIIGGADYTPATTSGEELSNLNLGQLPFLEELDVRNFPIKSINADFCPRMVSLLASGSTLQSLTLAETSPIKTLSLPATMANLSFVNLPNLVYPNGGLTIDGLAGLKRLEVSGSTGIDAISMLKKAITNGASVTEISLTGLSVSDDTTILDALMESDAKGIGTDLDNGCDGLVGTWTLTTLIEDDKLKGIQAYFPSLTVHNAQYTMISFDDVVDDPANISNLDNNTGYQFGNAFVASGHVARIRKNLIPVKGKLNTERGVWEGVKISEENYHNLANGVEFDYTDKAAGGFDVMMRCPALWYKGINDFKNQKKYIAWSSLTTEPLSTAKRVTRKKLKDIILKANTGVMSEKIRLNESTLESAGVLAEVSNVDVYKIDVEGMKQVRWPGMNNATVGACFVNADGLIISKYNMAIGNTLFDFVDGDYIFIDVPHDAKSFVFSSRNTNAELEAIAVDSSEVEAIEPDWVRSEEWLGGVYQASVDSLLRLRSVSGAPVRTGDGNHNTSSEWQYDENGEPTNMPFGTIHYTKKDFQNIAHRRGKGYQLFDYEMSKLMAILWFSLNGTRDAQLVCGYGRGPGGTTGYRDDIGNTDSKRADNNVNKCLGFESFFGCTWEVMDYVAVNVPTYGQFMKDKCVPVNTYPLDTVWHIYDPLTKTERTVQGLNTSGYCIARTKHGRYCDVIMSKYSSDTSRWASNYTDTNWHNNDRGRVVGRSGFYANAYSGLVFADSNNAPSEADSNVGSRLAFRGKVEISE